MTSATSSALVVIDLQRGFDDPALGPETTPTATATSPR